MRGEMAGREYLRKRSLDRAGDVGRVQPCGYFGKVPARADFVAARLRPDTIACWDAWLQQALTESQTAIGDMWQDLFFAAPIWRFILPTGACGGHALVGVLMPSVDSVGRCFPLMLAREIEAMPDPVGLMAGSGRWFAAAEALALRSLANDFDLAVFDRPLPGCATVAQPGPGRVADGVRRAADGCSVGRWAALPLASAAPALLSGWYRSAEASGEGIWWTTGASHFPPVLAMSPGLGVHRGFSAFLDGLWERHGWSLAASDKAATQAAEWDRET